MVRDRNEEQDDGGEDLRGLGHFMQPPVLQTGGLSLHDIPLAPKVGRRRTAIKILHRGRTAVLFHATHATAQR